MARRAARLRPLAAALALLAGTSLRPGSARADGLRLRYEPLVTVSDAESTDAAGQRTSTETTSQDHRAFLQFDRAFFPLLRFAGFATYERELGDTTIDGVPGSFDAQSWSLDGQLSVGSRELSGALLADRRESTREVEQDGLDLSQPHRISELYSATATWRPEGLPALVARVLHGEQRDRRRQVSDLSTDQAGVEASWATGPTDLRYRLDYLAPHDRLAGVENSTLRHELRTAYGDRLLDGRLTLSASYVATLATRETTTSGTGGTVATKQVLAQGLSAVEAFPATPLRVALQPNAGLADGDLTALAGLNLGFGPSVAGDLAFRDLGAELAITTSTVTAVHVWVDRALPAEVAAAYAWSAYRSDDNLTWTAVALAGPVVFSAFQNRFEIPIDATAARYLKVVTRPLAAGVTTDPRFSDVQVTELELLEVVAAEQARGTTRRLGGIASASARLRLLADEELYYESAVLLTHDHQTSRGVSAGTTFRYDLLNALAWDRRLRPWLSLTARLARTDADQGRGHEVLNRLTASLAATPLPSFASTLTYSAQLLQAGGEHALGNSLLLFTQAEPYRGVSLQANLGLSSGSNDFHRSTRTRSAVVVASLAPYSTLSLSGSLTYASVTDTSAGQASVARVNRRADGTASWAPVPALYLSATLGRAEVEGRPQRISTLSLNLRPFPGGALYLNVAYNESRDSTLEQRLRQYGPSLRWNIHAGTVLDLSWTVQDATSAVLDTRSSLLLARLTVTL